MKKLLLILFVAVLSFQTTAAGNVNLRIDERVELAALICRYGQIGHIPESNNEYSRSVSKRYARSFQHRLSVNLLAYQRQFAITPDAVFDEALTWELVGYKWQARKGSQSGLRDIMDDKTYSEYMMLVNEYYRDAEFHKWFVDNVALFDEIEQSVNQKQTPAFGPMLVGELNIASLDSLLGAPTAGVDVYVCLTTYAYDMALPLQKSVVLSGVSSMIGNNGKQVYYINPFVNRTLVQKIAEVQLYPLFEGEELALLPHSARYYSQATTLFNESHIGIGQIFRQQIGLLASLLYFEANEPMEFQQLLRAAKRRGFIWTNEMFDELVQFKSDRKKYPSLKDYYPALRRIYTSTI